MIAIDTNVLLRYLLQDDNSQSQKARTLITGSEPVLVTDVVLVETIWVLSGKRYGLGREAIAGVVSSLFKEPKIVFEDDQTVWRTLNDYRKAQPVKVGGKKKLADFPDALIVNKARYFAREQCRALSGVYTFDAAASEIDGTLRP